MGQMITAIFEDGVLKPEQPLTLPPGSKVQLIVLEPNESLQSADEAWAEFERLCDETHIYSGEHLTRDQLHERR